MTSRSPSVLVAASALSTVAASGNAYRLDGFDGESDDNSTICEKTAVRMLRSCERPLRCAA